MIAALIIRVNLRDVLDLVLWVVDRALWLVLLLFTPPGLWIVLGIGAIYGGLVIFDASSTTSDFQVDAKKKKGVDGLTDKASDTKKKEEAIKFDNWISGRRDIPPTKRKKT